jgi:hypothetical protein
LRGDDAKIDVSLEATNNSAPGALKRVLRKLKEKEIKDNSKPSDFLGFNQHYKLPDKYYYEPSGTTLFEQVTKKSNSNIVDLLKENVNENKFQMGTTYRVYEELRNKNNEKLEIE